MYSYEVYFSLFSVIIQANSVDEVIKVCKEDFPDDEIEDIVEINKDEKK